tara:strand:+ start:5398 stop:6168 length:771 start_codon:yes stop_codon:yes gene_type:complete
LRVKETVAVIPARMGSSRFPGKPLVKIAGLPMIEHVRRRVDLSDAIDKTVVATCDQEVLDLVVHYGGNAVMTATTHERCTDRVAEAQQEIDADIAVIVQGDEPLFDPDVLAPLVAPFHNDDQLKCSNLVSVIRNPADLDNVDIVKAILDENSNVMYFSRAAIPFLREGNNRPMYRQTGVSAFSRAFLTHFSNLPPTALEITESVDFLRILGHGHRIYACIHDTPTFGVDRPEDVAEIENILREDGRHKILFERISK